MATLEKFLSYLEEQVQNHSIYVWGAQGQKGTEITEEWIRKRETSTINAARAVSFWKKQVKAGYGDKLRAFDCSGLGVCFFLQNGLLKKDTTADGLLKLCTRISAAELRPGDFVFKTYASGKAYHVGYVVDAALNVIEAKGRDAGVVKGSLKRWNVYGRPPFWKEETSIAENRKPSTSGQAALERMKRYTVEIGVYSQQEEAETVLTKVKASGFANAYIQCE